MRACQGDWLVVKGAVVGNPDQRGQIVEVRGPDGAPPYVVRWLADDHVSVLFPGPDAQVVSRQEQARLDDEARARLARRFTPAPGAPH
ncbi:DUF1918 domain-containing protein [Amycolatopsis aidingensis]|uniref:DUF1918 domain-containing protein n=1 Tax=Amycolatopsis aidingensis TaxID=2842453 RepID=UPI001C0E3FCE|nr:DUF1918 domain-containing protein [Amycolatopsis aidingensis]